MGPKECNVCCSQASAGACRWSARAVCAEAPPNSKARLLPGSARCILMLGPSPRRSQTLTGNHPLSANLDVRQKSRFSGGAKTSGVKAPRKLGSESAKQNRTGKATTPGGRASGRNAHSTSWRYSTPNRPAHNLCLNGGWPTAKGWRSESFPLAVAGEPGQRPGQPATEPAPGRTWRRRQARPKAAGWPNALSVLQRDDPKRVSNRKRPARRPPAGGGGPASDGNRRSRNPGDPPPDAIRRRPRNARYQAPGTSYQLPATSYQLPATASERRRATASE